jgi:Big-like domain-containing protein
MKKNLSFDAGIFSPRMLLAFSLCFAGVFLATLSVASGGSRHKNAVRAVTPNSSTTVATFGSFDPTVPNNPRYQNFYAPAGSSAESGSGEFNIGFNPFSHHIFVMNHGPIWRLTAPELLTPAKPECCEALWEDKSAASTNTGLDPILWTDQKTGRTFASNSTAGANVVYAYTDTASPFNDGDQWVPVAISPPNGGVDHETIGSGPYPASLSNLATPVNQGEYVLYCSQDAVGSMCQRSDDLGASYGPGVISTGPGTMSSQGCGGLHGHVHIAPDGTAWLPDKSCGSSAGGALSLDAGTTPWTEFKVPNSVVSTQGSDPSIAFDDKSTAYYCYVNGEGNENHMHVAVGKRNGATINWVRDVDVGASQGIVNAVFPQAVGGSEGRAACGFFGTNVPGSFQGTTFRGDWYLFIATTYDEGRTWVTVNATPNDPVQRQAGVCLQGINCGASTAPRNLLDFNEVTMDEKGRVLFGYDDGCVSPECIAGARGNDGTAYMRVARQSGGKTLLTQFDPPEPIVPKAACLSGVRDCSTVHLSWKAPDNGGSDITGYAILRGTSPGAEFVLVANTGNANTTFDDPVDPSTRHYFYVVKAINAQGTGPISNEIDTSSELLAYDDVAVTQENKPVVINVLANDCGTPPLTVTAVSSPAHGVVNININGTVTYTPPNGYFGPDTFTYTVRNGLGATATRTVKVSVNALCALINTGSFNDNFESGAPGWIMQTAANNVPASHTWMIVADPSAHSPTMSFQSDATTLDLKDDRLIAPTQRLSTTSHLIFWHRFQFESGFDGGVVEVSTDGGSTWVDAIAGGGSFVTGAYNGTISPSFGSPIAGRAAWTAGDATAAMSKVEINLGAFAGLDVRVRFRLACDPFAAGSLPGVGWWIDDVQFTNTVVEGPCPTVVSRKTHGTSDFDITLPASGTPAIECRSGGASNVFTLIYTLNGNISATGSASVRQGTATPGTPTLGPNANQITVPLTNVANAQHLIVALDGVQDATGAILDNLVARMDVLLGDTTGNGAVNSSDIAQTQSQSGQLVTSFNFREDVTVSGSINSSDIALVQSKSGTALP